MSLLTIQNTLTAQIKQTVAAQYGFTPDHIAVEMPPKLEFGDFAFPIAFELAKHLKKETGEKQNPRAIAETLKEALLEIEEVSNVKIAGPGYLNVFLNRGSEIVRALNSYSLTELLESGDSTRICVEHTSINPNKATHIGHVRNSVLGDTFVRILQADGKRVEVQNYIDNTGVQVADVVVGFVEIEGRDLDSIKELDRELAEKGISFDFYCWDLYAQTGQEYQKNEALLKKRTETLHAIEAGDSELAELADYVATRNVECILKTMERLSIRYDLLPRESEILHLDFWQRAFELMQERGVIHLSEEGKTEGCWVMPFGSSEGGEEHDQDKILVRSNGTVTYTGKDIAYQMWKLGLLGMDFFYNEFSQYPDGKEVWITNSTQTIGNAPRFGDAEKVYNVIDTRQSYPQEVVKKGVALIFPDRGEEASVHLAYEMVALSPAAAEELGFTLSDDDRNRTFIEMSGRKGLGVKADDLIDRLIENATKEVTARNKDLSNEEAFEIAKIIAVGALRYFLLKFTKNTVIVFDFKEATSFEGETGAYCQNATVRLNSIFKKLDESVVHDALNLIATDTEAIETVMNGQDGDDFWQVVSLVGRLEETIKQATKATEPAILAKYTFNLAKYSNLFYQKHRILNEDNEAKRAVMIAVAEISRRGLTNALELLGIEVPARM